MVSFFFFGLVLPFTTKGRAAENYPYKEYNHNSINRCLTPKYFCGSKRISGSQREVSHAMQKPLRDLIGDISGRGYN